jgi:multiple sugar transport system permease protein
MRDSLSFRVVRAIVLTVLAAFVVVPVYVAVTSAFKPLGAIEGSSFQWWPSHFTVEAFIRVWPDLSLGLGFRNSLIVMAGTTLIATPIAVAAAFAISRYIFPGRKPLLLVMMSTQVFPGLLFLIPLYLIYFKIQTATGIQFIGSYQGLIITYLSFTLPLSTWILVGIMRRFPRDLEEAAMIDGLSEIRAFVRIVLPSMTGAIVAVAMFACITAWSELLFASVLTNGSTQTLPIALSSVVAAPSEVVRWNELMAGAIYASVPILVVFYLLQRQFVAGITAGATKG